MPERHRIRRSLILFLIPCVVGAGATLPDLAQAQYGAANSRTLLWTAPGDDSTSGRATRYDLRFSTNAISDSADSAAFASWWAASTALPSSQLPSPSVAGATDSALVTNLPYGSTYYFVIRTADEKPNWSGFSNVATATLPACSAPASAPSGLQAAMDSGAVSLTWSGSDPLATTIQIYRGSSPTRLFPLTTLPASQTSYTDAAVTLGSTYYYVAAWAADCGNGPFTPSVSIRVTAPGSGTASSTNHSIRAYPNPSDGPLTFVVDVQGTAPQPVRVRLYDMTGHWIASLIEGTYPAGESSVGWSRIGRTGLRVAPGYYEALGTVGTTKVRERIVLLP